MPSDNPDVSGVRRLRAFFLEDVQTSKRFEPFGPNPRGALIMHPEGRMVAVITPAERGLQRRRLEQAAAFQKLIAYSGRYRLEPPDRFVTNVRTGCSLGSARNRPALTSLMAIHSISSLLLRACR